VPTWNQSLTAIFEGAKLAVHYRAIGAERFWEWRLSDRFGSISYEEGWSRPGRPTQGHVEVGGNYMGGLEITIGTQTPGFGDHSPATRNSNNKIFFEPEIPRECRRLGRHK
jgi:hypothetical protein